MHRTFLAVALALPCLVLPLASRAQGGGEPPVVAGKPGEGAWANFDFVPGARVIFAEDFSKDRVGNFPQRLQLVNGNMEVVEWRGKRWLRADGSGPSNSMMVVLPEKLSQKFTIEFDLVIPWNGVGIYSADQADKLGMLSPDRTSSAITLSGTVAGILRAASDEGSTVDPRSLFEDMFPGEGTNLSRPFRVRVEADGRYMKLYLDEKRVSNMPNADFGRANKIIFDFAENTDTEGKSAPALLGNISINAGGKGLYDALMADGRVATQGILFDVGSDRIRGESTPTLKLIADMLNEHADLKLTVEGHTDNTGDAAANLALSERRAKAIVTYLTTTSKINAARLVAKGYGATKPVGANTTPEGRQANRRVELVKM